MSDLHISVSGTKRLLTAGKRHTHNIVVTAQGGADSAFWDVYQQNGVRTSYDGAFGGEGWTTEIFKPKYNINPTSAA